MNNALLTNTDTTTAIANALKGKSGQLGITLVYTTEVKMRKTNNPFVGRATKVTTCTNARMGVSYENCVNGKLARMGEERTFVAGHSNTNYLDEFFQVSKDGTKTYLKVGGNSTTKFDSVYLVDGRVATDEEMEAIRSFMPVTKPSQKQVDAGISADDVYIHITVNVDNISHIKQGDKVLYAK